MFTKLKVAVALLALAITTQAKADSSNCFTGPVLPFVYQTDFWFQSSSVLPPPAPGFNSTTVVDSNGVFYNYNINSHLPGQLVYLCNNTVCANVSSSPSGFTHAFDGTLAQEPLRFFVGVSSPAVTSLSPPAGFGSSNVCIFY